MSRREPSAALAAAMRESSSSSERPRYRSGSGCRSPIEAFSTSVRRGRNVPAIVVRPQVVKSFASPGDKKGQVSNRLLPREPDASQYSRWRPDVRIRRGCKPRLHNHTDVGQGFSPADKAALKGCPTPCVTKPEFQFRVWSRNFSSALGKASPRSAPQQGRAG